MSTKKRGRVDPASLRMAFLTLVAYGPVVFGVFGGLGWAVAKALAGAWLGAVGVLFGCVFGGAALTFAFVGLSHLLEGLVPDGGA